MPNITRNCKNTGIQFVITEEDQAFYEQMSVPLPTLCPQERFRRRYAWRNEINVFRVQSAYSGKSLFAMYPPDSPFPIVEKDYWWSDACEALEYGRDFDDSRSVFEQIHELSSVVPHFPLSIVRIEKSEYVNNASNLKKCYMVFNANDCEDVIYSDHIRFVRDCIDCSHLFQSELCYDCTMCEGCYNVQSSQFSYDCSDSYFLRNCQTCKHCFGCSNLYRKEYCIYNEQKTKEEYEEFVANLSLDSYNSRRIIQEKVQKFWKQFPQPHLIGRSVEHVNGNYIFNAQNVYDSYGVQDVEQCKYTSWIAHAKYCMDYSEWGNPAELVYESAVCGNGVYNVKFCYECYENCSDLEYCQFCISCKDCFACVGLKKKQYCILNKQYSETEYKDFVSKIKGHMRSQHEYGEFFPMWMSPLPYNCSDAQREFPFTQIEALDRGLRWHDETHKEFEHAIPAEDLPETVSDNFRPCIVNSHLSGKPFQITSSELNMYRKFHIPIPRMSYDERIEKRRAETYCFDLYTRKCAKTGKEIQTSYPPESDWIVWDKEEWDREYRG